MVRFPSMQRKKPVQRERGEQAAIRHLLLSLGAKVYTLGTTRRRGDQHFGTMQSPGLPDLIAFLKFPPAASRLAPIAEANALSTRQLLFIEVKAAGGRMRSEQIEFRGLAIASDVAHVAGDADAVIAWLVEHGHMPASSVAHYRQPKPSSHGVTHAK